MRINIIFILLFLVGCSPSADIEWDINQDEVSGVLICDCDHAVVEISVEYGEIENKSEFIALPGQQFTRKIDPNWTAVELTVKGIK